MCIKEFFDEKKAYYISLLFIKKKKEGLLYLCPKWIFDIVTAIFLSKNFDNWGHGVLKIYVRDMRMKFPSFLRC